MTVLFVKAASNVLSPWISTIMSAVRLMVVSSSGHGFAVCGSPSSIGFDRLVLLVLLCRLNLSCRFPISFIRFWQMSKSTVFPSTLSLFLRCPAEWGVIVGAVFSFSTPECWVRAMFCISEALFGVIVGTIDTFPTMFAPFLDVVSADILFNLSSVTFEFVFPGVGLFPYSLLILVSFGATLLLWEFFLFQMFLAIIF